MENYSSGLSGASLVAALTDASTSLELSSVPASLEAGTYRFKLDAEILTGDYAGAGVSFTNLQRGLEGTTAAAHRAAIITRHVITGASIQQILTVTTQDGRTALEGVRELRVPDGALLVDGTTATILGGGIAERQPQPSARPVAARLYAFNTFN